MPRSPRPLLGLALLVVGPACASPPAQVAVAPRGADAAPLGLASPPSPIVAPSATCTEPALAPAPARDAALTLYLAGQARDAAAGFRAALAVDPRDRAADVFRRAAEAKLAAFDAKNQETFAGRTPVVLAALPLAATLAHAIPSPGPLPSLTKVSEARNKITDDEDWEARTGTRSAAAADPGTAAPPAELGHDRLRRRLVHADHVVGLYSRSIVVAAEGKTPLVFDVSRAVDAAPRRLEPTFAQLVGGTLVVTLAYNGYAKETGGKNGYAAAFDAQTGALAWSSGPLVTNSAESWIAGGALVTGYGFTAEPDFLHVIALATGRIAQKIPLKSGPERIRASAKGDLLHVRTYDTDYVFRAEPNLPPAPAASLPDDDAASATAPTAEPCWLRRVTAALLARDAAALGVATDGLAAASRDRTLEPILREEARRMGAKGRIDLVDAPLVDAPAPPWHEQRGAPPATPARSPRLVTVRTRPRHGGLDERTNGPTHPTFLAPVQHGALPPGVRPDIPTSYGGRDLGAIVPDTRIADPGPPPGDARTLLLYGGRYVAVLDEARADRPAERVLDLGAFQNAPKNTSSWKDAGVEDATYAQIRGGVLYVCNGGGSYARDVAGKKGFLSALDATTGALLWRSAPLVCNATFAIAGDHLVTGYGFTDEPDFVFLVRRADGAIVQKVAVPDGPEAIVVDGNAVHVTTYQHRVDLELR